MRLLTRPAPLLAGSHRPGERGRISLLPRRTHEAAPVPARALLRPARVQRPLPASTSDCDGGISWPALSPTSGNAGNACGSATRSRRGCRSCAPRSPRATRGWTPGTYGRGPRRGRLLGLALLEPGDHVICTFPGYQSLYQLALSIGCEVTSGSPLRPRVGGSTQAGWRRTSGAPRHQAGGVELPAQPHRRAAEDRGLARMIAAASAVARRVFSDEMYRRLEPTADRRLPAAVDRTRGPSPSLACPRPRARRGAHRMGGHP